MLTHVAQFYEDDEAYCSMQVSFLDAALRAGDTGIVFATPAHRAALMTALARLRWPGAAMAPTDAGCCVMLDAAQTLSRFMVGGRLDAGQFRDVMSELIVQHVPADSRRVWVFAEMVGLLVDDGKAGEALQLEACWDELVRANRRYTFSTMCAYPQHALDLASNREWVPMICRAHSGICLPR